MLCCVKMQVSSFHHNSQNMSLIATLQIFFSSLNFSKPITYIPTQPNPVAAVSQSLRHMIYGKRTG